MTGMLGTLRRAVGLWRTDSRAESVYALLLVLVVLAPVAVRWVKHRREGRVL